MTLLAQVKRIFGSHDEYAAEYARLRAKHADEDVALQKAIAAKEAEVAELDRPRRELELLIDQPRSLGAVSWKN